MSNNLKNKKVTVMGLGLHGGGVACVNWLAKQGAKVTVTDLKTKKDLRLSVDKVIKGKDVKFVFGKHHQSDFKKADLIVQNPGVPRESEYLKIAKKANVPIENEASLFFKYCPAKIIGVTGTRGKSTTSSLIYEILRVSSFCHPESSSRVCEMPKQVRHDKKKVKAKVWLAGLPQKPMLEILDKARKNDLVILELSSWQLEILGENKLSPEVAVFTNIYPDHLNRYSGMKEYIAAKKNIFMWQNSSGFSILNLDNFETKKAGESVKGQRFWFSKKYFSEQNGVFLDGDIICFRRDGQVSRLADRKSIKLAGRHNLENILAALSVAGIFKIKSNSIRKVLADFSGLPGRIELIREINGIEYINDTTATTPDGAIAAIQSLSQKNNIRPLRTKKQKNIILIAGGDTKNIPDKKYEELSRFVRQKCKAVILFSGKGSDQFSAGLKKNNFRPLISKANTMLKAITIAKSFAEAGDIILLSPACSSFNLFKNEFDRGRQFNEIVNYSSLSNEKKNIRD